ncbi:uncharacterized protein LOC18437584 [Amborella trichopoda]|uniref:SET domain-containing protein n=1 Tax=Amborella trichopoda TaxID=13333 RepID=W1PNX5_AMBTC|nr:uncharacterized protein LOC18437584 [Amborella trichopoda]XP_020524906.1 uncharacterized protein LOC18437584 [Amborella trichopoda]ERN09431.1 hypothetical protein AMTR_s00029p00065560 [Amborella trichopoda]|eukprot:XP_006847850.1 uncharacterized protein LOC18437584 [Amborella trichopoda]
MASLLLKSFNKFRQFVKVLSKNSMFEKDPRQLQFEADMNRLFLYTSYNILGKNADAKDAEEIIEIASKASVGDQQKQVQENVHAQIKSFCASMDEILLPELNNFTNVNDSTAKQRLSPSRPSGLSFALGRTSPPAKVPVVPTTLWLQIQEVSELLKEKIGYTLELKPSEIHHEEAGTGVFIKGEAEVGSVVAFYPGIIYSPDFYRYIPGYPRIDANNPYLISRYDGTVIDAQPWGPGGEAREFWDGFASARIGQNAPESSGNSDRFWRILSKPLEFGGQKFGEVLEKRNPLARGHYVNHPAKDFEPNVMVCPYDFPFGENGMRVYIPNLVFGGEEGENKRNMRRYGSFWLRMGKAEDAEAGVLLFKTLVLVSTRRISDGEEVLLNYRLSNAKRRPAWYQPVDEEEDKRRWG